MRSNAHRRPEDPAYSRHERPIHRTASKVGQVGPSDARWQAVLARDRAADNLFVFAVRSTGVYCRPSCPSRHPHPRNVAFFPTPDLAESAGFRACLRCRPREVVLRDPQAEGVARVCRQIEAEMRSSAPEAESLKLGALSASANVSPHQLIRAFRRILGISPRQYTDAHRMLRLKARLKKGDDVTTALYDAGFGSSSRLYENAPARLGMTPATYGRGGEGMKIGYTIKPSPLGRLLVAATARGVSALYLGEEDKKLEAALAKEYPRAEIHRDRAGLERWVDAVLKHLRGREPHLDLPTDVQATAFQRRVWEELRKIPYGTTRTYSQIAQAIGRPRAIRAVARACATNPVSIVVPCHRVVRGDGNLAGYRWGLGRKQTLIAHEREFAGKERRT